MSDPHRIAKYDILARLAQGGMGNVYLARAHGGAGFSKLVVVKTLRTDFADDPKFCEMFLDEARLAARLNHRNVVQTNDAGVDEGIHFMVMDFLDGRSLWRVQKQLTRDGKTLPLAVGVRILAEMLAGLHHAHELVDADGKNLGVVHRDVCPANVFVTVDGQVKVVDFGVAKAKTHAHETQAGTIKGRVAYMSPEHVQAGPIDRRADVFSAGIMLWELLAGRRFWDGLGETQILGRLLRGQTPDLVPIHDAPLLQLACGRALAKAPDDRFPTAHAMRLALEEWLERNEPRGGLADLGATILAMTADERARIAKLVDAAPHADRTAPLPALDPARLGAVGDSGVSSLKPPPSIGTGALAATPMATMSPIVPEPKRGYGVAVGAAIGAAALAAAVTFAVNRPSAELSKPAAPPSAATVEAPREISPPAPPPRDTTVTLDVSVSPVVARVFLDERPLGANPFHGPISRDDRPHVIRAEAPGYKPRAFSLSLDRDRAIEISLDAYTVGHGVTPTVVPKGSAPSAAPTETSGIRELPVKPSDTTKPALDTDVFKK